MEDVQIRISEVNRLDDFVALKDHWNDLVRRSCGYQNIFLTWEWLCTWWKFFGKNKRLVILLAEEKGRLIGIAPLMYSVHKIFGLRQGKIEFLGRGYPDYPCYTDFILEPKYGDKCISVFFDYLNSLRENWRYVELSDIPEDGKCLQSLSSISRNVEPAYKCLYTPLPETYDALLNALKRKDRKELRRNARRLERAGFEVKLVDYSGIDSVVEGITILFTLNQKRWQSKESSGKFADRVYKEFTLETAKLFSQNGWLGLYCLELSGSPAASLYGFQFGRKYYAYISGMDPKYYSYSIGTLLLLKVMAKNIQDGLAEFDFTWGTEEYKKRLNAIERRSFKAIVPRRGTVQEFENFMFRMYWSQGTRIKYLLNRLLRKRVNYERKM